MPPRDTTVVAAAADDRIASLTAGTSDVPRKYTAAQVEKHSTPEDCWLIVHEKVYDVTSFVPRHPGGNMIWVKAGGDCTQLFDSYHPLRTQMVLDKYYIGELRREAGPGLPAVRRGRVLHQRRRADHGHRADVHEIRLEVLGFAIVRGEGQAPSSHKGPERP